MYIHAVVCAKEIASILSKSYTSTVRVLNKNTPNLEPLGFFFSSKECPAWKIIPELGYVVNNLRIGLDWNPSKWPINGGDPNHLTGMILQGGDNPPPLKSMAPSAFKTKRSVCCEPSWPIEKQNQLLGECVKNIKPPKRKDRPK